MKQPLLLGLRGRVQGRTATADIQTFEEDVAIAYWVAEKLLGAVLLELAGNLPCRVLGKSVQGSCLTRDTLLPTTSGVLGKLLASVLLPGVHSGSWALDRLCAVSKHTRPRKENSFPLAVFHQCPLLTKLNIMLIGKGKHIQRSQPHFCRDNEGWICS